MVKVLVVLVLLGKFLLDQVGGVAPLAEPVNTAPLSTVNANYVLLGNILVEQQMMRVLFVLLVSILSRAPASA